jgi:DoxX-like family
VGDRFRCSSSSVVEGWVCLGYDGSLASGIRVVERLGAVLYLMPRPSVLGAMRLTGRHGDATATHVRAGEPYVAPVVLGQLVWEGLFRRDERLHVRLPL